ncbi:MAG: outer membrane beta-barrel protein [Thermoanaerobaculia bacterium]|nr:MAG: outer membrane beta-barrel protein [Thermoanaerobaculia bacterium]MBZ0100749.1 porin family protein [Thermoanaerobaculia bacterium]
MKQVSTQISTMKSREIAAVACAQLLPAHRAARVFWAFVLAATFLVAVRPATASEIGFNGVGVSGGVVMPVHWDTGQQLSVHVDLGTLTRGLYLQPSASYWRATGSDTISSGVPFIPDITFDREMTNLALGADVLWYPADERRGWYVGGGAYINRVEYEIFGGKLTDERVGGNAIGGYDFSLGGGSAFVEARYHVLSGFNTAQLGLGFRFGS